MKKQSIAVLILCGYFLLAPLAGQARAAEPCSVEVHLQQNGEEKVETLQGLSGDIPFLRLRDFSALTDKYIHWFGDSGAIGWTEGQQAFFTHARSNYIYIVDCAPVYAEELPKQEIKAFVPTDVVETPVPDESVIREEAASEAMKEAGDTSEGDEAENGILPTDEILSEPDSESGAAADDMDSDLGTESEAAPPAIIGWQYTVKKEKLPTPLTVEKDQTYIHSSLLPYLGYAGVWQEPKRQYVIEKVENGMLAATPPLEEAYGKIKATLIKDLPTEPTVLGRYKTSFNPKEKNRTINLKLAAAAINGQVIQPGKTFSFNKTVGARTRERGYLEATIFVGGKKEQGLGGGICQVSSTLYNAVLAAKLKVVERHTHSLPVTYVPTGKDATVSYGYLDFRFQNHLKYPVKIQAVVNKNTLEIAFISANP